MRPIMVSSEFINTFTVPERNSTSPSRMNSDTVPSVRLEPVVYRLLTTKPNPAGPIVTNTAMTIITRKARKIGIPVMKSPSSSANPIEMISHQTIDYSSAIVATGSGKIQDRTATAGSVKRLRKK